MSNKKLVLILSSIAVLAVLVFVGFQLTSKDPALTPETQPTPDTTKTYTAVEVSRHNVKDDCWTVIAGNVYDITSYIKSHPGGDDILRACGQDSTNLFLERQTESGESVGTGTPHSQSAQAQLEKLRIGTLAN